MIGKFNWYNIRLEYCKDMILELVKKWKNIAS
jgi:hypothetical protein